MVLMVSAGLRIGAVVAGFDSTPGWHHLHTPLWTQLAYQTDHTQWVGCSLWDLIQPAFMFVVGTALAFSLANRRAAGQSFGRMLAHALLRSLLLLLLSVMLASNGKEHERTNWSFTIVLAQIGLGYPFLFLLAWTKPRWQFVAAAGVLVAYWAAFAIYPRPAADLDLASVGLRPDWHRLTGFASHWDKNTNLAAQFDQWFLNLFPRADVFKFEPGGYQTLNFVPSLATMIFGLLAGELLRTHLSAAGKLGRLLGFGLLGLALGWALDAAGLCPLSKRIWTPSWTLFSTGWVLVTLAVFYLVVDVWRFQRWSYPLVVVGANSIAVYCMSMMLKPWVRETVKRHFGKDFYEIPGYVWGYLRYGHNPANASQVMGQVLEPMGEAGVFLLFCWVVCAWMYRRKIFIKL
jgi:predicted acyltransferase